MIHLFRFNHNNEDQIIIRNSDGYYDVFTIKDEGVRRLGELNFAYIPKNAITIEVPGFVVKNSYTEEEAKSYVPLEFFL